MAVFERTTRERSSLFTPSLFHCWFIDPTKIPSDLCPPSSLLITPPPIGERSILMSARACVCLSAIISSELNVRSSLIFCACYLWPGGSVAEWLACWTQAQKARVQITVATLSDNSLRQTAYTHCASVHQAVKLVAALLRVAGVTAGLAESNGSLLPGLWLTLPAGWLPRTGISSGTLRSVIEWATFAFFYLWPWRLWQWLGPPLAA